MNFNVNNTGYNAYRTAYDHGLKTDRQAGADKQAKAGNQVKRADKPDYGEGTLSVKAQDFLKKLRDRYGDLDVFVGDSDEALNRLAAGSDKDVSVMFSADEIEKMAEDESYADERLSQMETAVTDARKFVEDYNESDESKESGTVITGIRITMNDDGTTSVFAELEKVNKDQQERLDAKREAKAKEAKAKENKDALKPEKPEKTEKAEKTDKGEKADGIDGPGKAGSPGRHGLRTGIEAGSLDELLSKIRSFDWSTVDRSDEKFKGRHFDFSV